MSAAAHQERILTVLEGPHLSEKSHIAAEINQIVFKVRTDATKRNYQGKQKRHGSTRGRRASWKKAYVRLAEGSQIDFLGGE